jgi:hypothetical protein
MSSKNNERLWSHKDEIEQSYFVDHESYQQIANRYGKSREAIRQFLNHHFPDRPKGWELRRSFKEEERKLQKAEEDLRREKEAPPCVICYEPVLRKAGGHRDNRTCNSHHSKLWTKARYLLDEGQRNRHRESLARGYIRYSNDHTLKEIEWANDILNGKQVNPRPHRDSQGYRAYKEVLRIRAGKEKDEYQ